MSENKKSDAAPAEDFATRLSKAVALVSDAMDADVIVYFGGISRGCDIRLQAEIARGKNRPNIAFFIATTGGDPDAAYRIAKSLQRSYEKFSLFVLRYCKSAGTLISVGADEIILSDMAELGPLDIQLAKQDDLFGRDSGLTPLQALTILQTETFKSFEEHFMGILTRSGGLISTQSAARFATQLTAECYSTIYQQIDPMKLAEYDRAVNITFQYGQRLHRGNLRGVDKLKDLIMEYPSHGFVIDREEACTLFREVRSPSPEEQELIDLLYRWGSGMAEKTRKTVVDFLSGKPKIKPKAEDGKSNGKAKNGTTKQVPSKNGKAASGGNLASAPGSRGPQIPVQHKVAGTQRRTHAAPPKTSDGDDL